MGQSEMQVKLEMLGQWLRNPLVLCAERLSAMMWISRPLDSSATI
jgi:hypothetical protein